MALCCRRVDFLLCGLTVWRLSQSCSDVVPASLLHDRRPFVTSATAFSSCGRSRTVSTVAVIQRAPRYSLFQTREAACQQSLFIGTRGRENQHISPLLPESPQPFRGFRPLALLPDKVLYFCTPVCLHHSLSPLPQLFPPHLLLSSFFIHAAPPPHLFF